VLRSESFSAVYGPAFQCTGKVEACRAPEAAESVVRVRYATRDGQKIGTQKGSQGTSSTSGELVFQSKETTKDLYVLPFQDSDLEYEAGEGFFVDLSPVEGCKICLLRSTVSAACNVAAYCLAKEGISMEIWRKPRLVLLWSCRLMWSLRTRHILVDHVQ
jgi:hypothetical protein